MKTVRRPPYPKWNPGYFPCSSLTPLPLSSRRPSVSFGGFGLRAPVGLQTHPHLEDGSVHRPKGSMVETRTRWVVVNRLCLELAPSQQLTSIGAFGVDCEMGMVDLSRASPGVTTTSSTKDLMKALRSVGSLSLRKSLISLA